ncbi:MAG: hypothetical protein WCU88_08450 [Elusimicrobiota bacterium]
MELFFNSGSEDEYDGTAYKGLKRLARAGLVGFRTYTNLPRIYSLTGLGHRILRREGINTLPACAGELAESLVRHELLVNAVGLVLSEVLGLRVWTELERYQASLQNVKVRRNEQGFSDLWIEDDEQPKAVEIERTQKSAVRYAKLWRAFRVEYPRNCVVLYVTCFPGGAGILLRRARKLMADHIYVCALEDFQSSLGMGPFVGYRGGEVELRPPKEWISSGNGNEKAMAQTQEEEHEDPRREPDIPGPLRGPEPVPGNPEVVRQAPL